MELSYHTRQTFDHFVRVVIPIAAGVSLLTWATTYLIAPPSAAGIGYAPVQPIPFSHLLHSGTMKIDCQYCHTTALSSRFAGTPTTDMCMNCHSIARADRPTVQMLYKYFRESKPIHWKRVYREPEFVYFDHRLHALQGIACEICHGPVAEMEVLRQDQSIGMAGCILCHRNPRSTAPTTVSITGPDNCGACHR